MTRQIYKKTLFRSAPLEAPAVINPRTGEVILPAVKLNVGKSYKEYVKIQKERKKRF